MSIHLSNNDKLNLISSLGTMLSAGIPILEAVESLIAETKGGSRKILIILKADLNQGKTISSTLERFPNVFNPVTINLVRSAEESGTLEGALKDISINVKKDIDFNEKVRAALIYPLMVMLVFSGVLGVILVFVVPRVSQVFSKLKIDLPLPTRILLFTSDLILHNTLIFISAIAAFIVVILILYTTKKKFLMNVFFSLPLLSTLAREIDLTRFTHNMSLMLVSGIPLPNALELSQHVVSKDSVLRAIIRAKHAVTGGKHLSDGFKQNRQVIPSVMILITEAGEKSGTLEKSMAELNEYFDAKVTSSLKTLTTLLEPILLVFVGLLVGGIMLAIVAPIYGLIGKISGR